MWANDETCVLFPVERIAKTTRLRGVLYHCDAVQAAGKVEIEMQNIPVDYLRGATGTLECGSASYRLFGIAV